MFNSLKKKYTIVDLQSHQEKIRKKSLSGKFSKGNMFILLDTFLDIFLFRQWRHDIAVDAHGWCLRAMRDEIEARGSAQFSFRDRPPLEPPCGSEV